MLLLQETSSQGNNGKWAKANGTKTRLQKTGTPPEELCLWREGCLQKTEQILATRKELLKIDPISQVSEMSVLQILQDMKLFKAGNIAKNYSLCENITNDNFILNIVREGLDRLF